MKFHIKPEIKQVELRDDNNEIVKIARLLPAYPIVFLYSEDESVNSLKYHTFEYSVKEDCIYFDGLQYKENTVKNIVEDVKVQSFVFLEEFELEKFKK